MNALVRFGDVSESIAGYKKHTLQDLNNSVLMNRVDTKYLLHIKMLPDLLLEMAPYFSLLDINNNSMFKYRSTYYDTDAFDFYNMHHRGKLNRFKVRVREYVDAKTKFLEVKFKNNKGRTIKTRKEIPQDANDIRDYSDFLKVAGLDNVNLKQTQMSEYYRLALASEERGERLTVDLNLTHLLKDHKLQRKITLDNVVIVELKQQSINRDSPIFPVLRKLGLRASGFSKYCMGMVYTSNPTMCLKSNRFKPICRRVENIKSPKLLAC